MQTVKAGAEHKHFNVIRVVITVYIEQAGRR
jgi:hypothetical protein